MSTIRNLNEYHGDFCSHLKLTLYAGRNNVQGGKPWKSDRKAQNPVVVIPGCLTIVRLQRQAGLKFECRENYQGSGWVSYRFLISRNAFAKGRQE